MRSPDGEPRSNAILRSVHDPSFLFLSNRRFNNSYNPQIAKRIDPPNGFEILPTINLERQLFLGDDYWVIEERGEERSNLSFSP